MKKIGFLFATTIMIIIFAFSASAETYSGECGANGNNLTWTLDTETSVLKISGNGAMKNYSYNYNQRAPWYSLSFNTVVLTDGLTSIGSYAFKNKSSLKSITIPDGVTSIGNCAFEYCYDLTSVTIPCSVKEIDLGAFSGCDDITSVYITDIASWCKISFGNVTSNPLSYSANLYLNGNLVTELEIPSSITSIGKYSFYACKSLKEVLIPDGVTSIGAYSFYSCTNLTNITIPESVTNISNYAFRMCKNLKKISLSQDNQYYLIDEYGALLDKSKTIFIQYPAASSGTEYIIPDSITNIDEGMFYYCKNLTSITIPDSVTNIDSYAFQSCSSLKCVTIPDSIKSIGDYAFYCCSSLETLTIGNSVKSIGNYAFYNCTNLKSVTIPDSVTRIGEYVFTYCTNLVNVEIGNGVRTISEYAFYRCGSLATVIIPDSVTTICYAAFCACYDLAHVYYYGSEEQWKSISNADTYYSGLSWAKIHYYFDSSKEIIVFSSEPSFSVKTGESMWLGFGLCNEFGYIEEDWRKMSVVVSDPTILSLSEYTITDYGYSLEVIAKKQGATTLTISDTENGLSRIIRVIVTDTYSKTYSYAIDNMVKFYPQNSWEDDILTNIYNLNGIYVNNYNCQKNENGYTVAFDVYNAKYFNGAVDVYDADGNWKESKKIEKYSDISSLVDVGKQGYYIVADFITGKMFTYEQASYSKHTKVEIEVPEGGYFTISNNMSESIGTFLYNSFEILFKGASEVIELATSDSNEVYLANFTKLFEDEIKKSPVLREVLMEKFLDTAESEIEKISENVLEGDVDNAFSGLSEFLENLLDSLDISWKHYFQISTGCGQKIFTAFSGPAGTALKSVFAITEGTSDMLFAIQMAKSLDEPYATVYSSLDTGYVNPYGIVVTENNNVDEEAVLQVFKVTDNGDFDDEISELYNICFVKNDELVQPTGMVKVYIPIPENMIASTCTIYRQETDGIWTALVTTVEGNYLVFETDHFSLYAITGDEKELGISSQPNILQYEKGDVLNADGLSLILGDGIVSSGFVCEPTVLSNCGEEIITVKYKGLSTSFTVWVNHTYITEIKAPATHTKEGVLTYTCSECGDSYTDKIDKTTEHTYNEKFIAPSCTETGYTVYTCECGDTYISDYISETGHSDNNNDGTCDGCGIKLSTTDNENCSCNCHKSGLMGIIWKILRFFYKLFKINPVCACGVAHY